MKPHMLAQAPFNLNDAGINWVEETIASMTLEEKIGQLFVAMVPNGDKADLDELMNKYHVGGIRYPGMTSEAVSEMTRYMQANSKVPLLIAANGEAGGSGAASDGTLVGNQIKVAATNNPEYAYELGRITGMEANAVGCNWNYAPLVDLMINWRNPIINNRTWSDDTDLTIEFSLKNMKGLMENNVMPTAKHFPGDGFDERDHHLSLSTNTMTAAEWDASFGRIYQTLIDAGLPAIMTGHIALPSYDDSMLPASLSHHLLQGLLRDKLGFNGLIVSDASHMVGMTAAMPRRIMVPTAIENGCDMFLFFNDPEEDFNFMLKGYENNLLSEERLHQALLRILGLKAKIGLHLENNQPSEKQTKEVIGLAENKALFDQITDESITLVKDKQVDLLPMAPEKYKRVLLVPVNGYGSDLLKLFKPHPVNKLAELLEKQGFETTVWRSTEEVLLEKVEAGEMDLEGLIFSAKRPVQELSDNYDLIINIADVKMGATVQRPAWTPLKGTVDVPFYVHEVPTIMISVNSPFLLADAPQVGTYINTYDGEDRTLEILVDKLMGASPFKGVSPVDAFCGLPDTGYWWEDEHTY